MSLALAADLTGAVWSSVQLGVCLWEERSQFEVETGHLAVRLLSEWFPGPSGEEGQNSACVVWVKASIQDGIDQERMRASC